ncbi:hypothetical protein P280DRAFT_550461 [Massarina eburnea CBS 473.64]|uniref:Uncharacterized protein n=1 Tax=Massarina eburnea CBS 473.64 TaxID=1395130 RepID=A0A6A6RYD7_9PLEO|nr:hypothetical protein P280DRAFT_550461 [Massarina eburnea CBS 473.64]
MSKTSKPSPTPAPLDTHHASHNGTGCGPKDKCHSQSTQLAQWVHFSAPRRSHTSNPSHSHIVKTSAKHSKTSTGVPWTTMSVKKPDHVVHYIPVNSTVLPLWSGTHYFAKTREYGTVHSLPSNYTSSVSSSTVNATLSQKLVQTPTSKLPIHVPAATTTSAMAAMKTRSSKHSSQPISHSSHAHSPKVSISTITSTTIVNSFRTLTEIVESLVTVTVRIGGQNITETGFVTEKVTTTVKVAPTPTLSPIERARVKNAERKCRSYCGDETTNADEAGVNEHCLYACVNWWLANGPIFDGET